jgi:transcriptional regulator with XRE-family HTH domain
MSATFALWLRARMTERHWSYSRTGQLCNVSANTVSDWLMGQHRPHLNSIRVIAWAFGVSELEVYCAIAGVTDDHLRAELARRQKETP